MKKAGKLYIGRCPIHLGDNSSALNLYPEGDVRPGLWRCNTKKCHTIFKDTIIGFARGVLSQQENGWVYEDGAASPKIVSFNKLVKWLCELVNQKWDSLDVDTKSTNINEFASRVNSFKAILPKSIGPLRKDIRARLSIPSPYYIKRGFAAETLDHFDVGLCTTPTSEMYQRSVVPIYDDSGRFAVAYTGRSIFEKCDRCSKYHCPTERCPDSNHRKYYKWSNLGNTGGYLYNWWGAKDCIRDKGCAILVESPGNLFRLYEANLRNVLGTLGNKLSDQQEIILEKSGASRIIVIKDNDAAGEAMEADLHAQLKYYRLHFITPKTKDVGEMPVEQIKNEIIPQIQGFLK